MDREYSPEPAAMLKALEILLKAKDSSAVTDESPIHSDPSQDKSKQASVRSVI